MTASGNTISQILASAKQYQGKIVKFSGFLVLDFERQSIYPTEDIKSWSHRLWVRINWEKYQEFNGKYVTLEGIFDEQIKGRLNFWPGCIKKVLSIRIE